MGKKKLDKAKSAKPRRTDSSGHSARSAALPKLPTVWFAIGDADDAYTEGKFARLARRLEDQLGWNIVVVSHDDEIVRAAAGLRLRTVKIPIESHGVTVADRLRATDMMIRETANVEIPGSSLPLWKVLAMDDFLSSLQLFEAQPKIKIEADMVILPLTAIDNNTRASCGLYTWLVAQARRQAIPVVGLEVSPLGNKNTISQLPVDYYAVKSHWSKEFLLRQGMARADQVAVLRREEAYILWPGQEDYVEAYLPNEAKARQMLGLDGERFVVVIPHHVGFLWEVRNILAALALVQFPISVVIRVDARTMRRQYHERDLVMECYGQEIRALSHVVIDERVGIGLLTQLADLVIAPFAGTTTERAFLYRKPAIICQAMAQEGWQGESIYWEPVPQKIPELIHAWKAAGRLDQTSLARIVARLMPQAAQAAA